MISLEMRQKPKISIISGSPRNSKSCSGGDSKTSAIVSSVIRSDIAEFKVFDLCVLDDKPMIMPCKGCISTANGFQCHYPCTCYSKGSENPDYMHEMDVYNTLENSDIILTFTPIHWYTVSSVVKAFFDRLVCINLTLTAGQAKKLFGDKYKDSDLTTKAELSGKHKDLLTNHYNGKIFGIFAHGDEGADDYQNRVKPTSLTVDNKESSFNQLIGLMPLAFQMRYSGLNVPDDLVEYHRFGKNIPYTKNNETFGDREWILEKAQRFVKKAVAYLNKQPTQNVEAEKPE